MILADPEGNEFCVEISVGELESAQADRGGDLEPSSPAYDLLARAAAARAGSAASTLVGVLPAVVPEQMRHAGRPFQSACR